MSTFKPNPSGMRKLEQQIQARFAEANEEARAAAEAETTIQAKRRAAQRVFAEYGIPLSDEAMEQVIRPAEQG